MTIADHPGCWNAVRKPGYWAPDRVYRPDGSFVEGYTYIEDTASTACMYDRNQEDRRCDGCRKKTPTSGASS